MGKLGGFIDIPRKKAPVRPADIRVSDWQEITLPVHDEDLRQQGARCMDCGVPFCHQGCPLGNVIPDWNDLVYRDRWRGAIERLQATNNFPEFTGRLCPAPCEGACVLGINGEAVAIRDIEVAIVERAFEEGWIGPEPPVVRTWKKVAVVGSGPSGLAAADQLNRAGHSVTVFERANGIGGLLRYGVPGFKMEKRVLDRRLALLETEGVVFRPNTIIGQDVVVSDLRRAFDATVLACGAERPRDLAIPGRDLAGIHFAMEFLAQESRRAEGGATADRVNITAAGKRVVIIGGGDTGADCLGTALRQGCRSVTQFELLPRPPDRRATDNPWPQWPNVFRTSAAHEEGGERVYGVATERFIGDTSGHVRRLHGVRVERVVTDEDVRFVPVPGGAFSMDVDLVLLSMGFTGPEPGPLLGELGVTLTERGTVWCDERWMTNVPGVFAAGDMRRGASLVVWAIAEGRSVARSVDAFLMGQSKLPAPLRQS